jgi:hypothetical protein
MGARAVRGRSGWSDGGSDTWGIEIPAFDKASLYQTIVTEVPAFFPPKQLCISHIFLKESHACCNRVKDLSSKDYRDLGSRVEPEKETHRLKIYKS